MPSISNNTCSYFSQFTWVNYASGDNLLWTVNYLWKFVSDVTAKGVFIPERSSLHEGGGIICVLKWLFSMTDTHLFTEKLYKYKVMLLLLQRGFCSLMCRYIMI